jgi:SAM-dependent methyltransferase
MESMLLHCPHCDIRYLHPRPNAQVLAQHYSNAKVLHGTSTLERYLERIHNRNNDIDLRNILGWIEQNFHISLEFLHSGLMIDVGCNAAGLLRAAADLGIRCLGIEVDAELCERNREHVKCEVYSGMFDTLPTSYDGLASIVILRDSLEHLLDPVESLKIAHRLLKPGGIVFIDVPNFDCSFVQHNIEAYDWFEADHLFYFSNQAIVNTFNISGFFGAATHTPVGEIDRLDASLMGYRPDQVNDAYDQMLLREKRSRKLWCAGLRQ